MNKRILVLNSDMSGMNKFLFAELQKRGWDLFIENVPVPRRLRWIAVFLSFSLNLRKWKRNCDYKLNKLYKSSGCFRWRTQYCERLLEKYKGKIDLIFQISGMFAPSLSVIKIPYVVYTDYTMRLAEKYEPWASSKEEIERWCLLEKQLYINARLNFVCCENTRRSFINDYEVEAERAINVGFGATFDELDQGEKMFDNKMILFVGFDFERKGGPVLLEAFKMVRQNIPAARLVVIGPSKKVWKIEQEGVEFLGPVSDRNVVKQYFKDACVFAMPSQCEPFGLVFLEAMAHQLPCIGANADAMPEIIEDGKTGFIVERDDAEQLADRLMRILGDRDMAKRMGTEGFERVKVKFNWDRIGSCVHSALSELGQ